MVPASIRRTAAARRPTPRPEPSWEQSRSSLRAVHDAAKPWQHLRRPMTASCRPGGMVTNAAGPPFPAPAAASMSDTGGRHGHQQRQHQRERDRQCGHRSGGWRQRHEQCDRVGLGHSFGVFVTGGATVGTPGRSQQRQHCERKIRGGRAAKGGSVTNSAGGIDQAAALVSCRSRSGRDGHQQRQHQCGQRQRAASTLRWRQRHEHRAVDLGRRVRCLHQRCRRDAEQQRQHLWRRRRRPGGRRQHHERRLRLDHGPVDGVCQGGAATLSNAGSIGATAGAGADFEGGGSITNLAGGTISGSSFGVFLTGGAGTVTNAGTISGATYAVDLAGRAGSDQFGRD